MVRDFDVSNEYAGAIRRVVPAIGMQRGRPSREVVLNVFEAREVAVTTIYLPIDLKNGRLFINQTYEGMLAFWSPRARIAAAASGVTMAGALAWKAAGFRWLNSSPSRSVTTRSPQKTPSAATAALDMDL